MDDTLEGANEVLRKRVRELVQERDELAAEVEFQKQLWVSHGRTLRNMGFESMQLGGMSYDEIKKSENW